MSRMPNLPLWGDSVKKIVRRTDPDTSRIAAVQHTASGTRQSNKLAVLEAVRQYPGRTAVELAAALPDKIDRYEVSRRLPELVDAGVIKSGDSRECEVRHTQQLTWWPIHD